jgi:hypothetical protein
MNNDNDIDDSDEFFDADGIETQIAIFFVIACKEIKK